MAFTGKLGTIDSRPANIILGGDSPDGGGGGNIFDRTIELTIDLTSVASCHARSVSAESTLVLDQACSTTTPWHKEASSALSFTITVGSSIKMLTASSPLSLTSTAQSNVLEVSASSALALDSAARATTVEPNAESTLSLTDSARLGLFKPTAGSALSLTITVVESGVRRTVAATSALSINDTASTPRVYHKSASSAITLVSAGIGIGPIVKSAADALSLTDAARSGVWMASASNAIAMVDFGRQTEILLADASNALSLTDSAVAFNLHVYATSALALTDTSDTREKPRSATTTIDTLTSTATAEVVHNAISELVLTSTAVSAMVGKRAENELEFEHEARSVSVKVGAEEHVIALTQEATSNIKMLSIEDALALSDTLFVNRPWYASAESELITVEEEFDLETFTLIEVVTGLQDSATCTLISVRPTSNIISFSTEAIGSHVRADGIDCEAESVLSLTQQVWNSIAPSASSKLALSQSATATTSRAALSELSTLDVAAQVVVIRGVLASNGLELQQAVSFIFEKSDTLCTYSPFIGSSSDPNAPAPPPATYPAAGGTPGFRLQYPATGPVTDQLVLRAPNLGNLDRLSMTRINRETRGGTLIIYADPIWPKVETLVLSFSGLSEQEGQNLLAFMENYLGQEIKLIDWEDRLWRGVITNPSDPVVPDGPGCKYTASFEFEGEKV